MNKEVLNSSRCTICSGPRLYYVFSLKEGYRVVRCHDCDFMTLSPQPTDQQLAEIYSADYFLSDKDGVTEEHFRELKQSTAKSYLKLIEKYMAGRPQGTLLEIGCGEGDFLIQAEACGFQVSGVEYNPHVVERLKKKLNSTAKIYCGEIDVLEGQRALYDVCILSDVIEHVRDPRDFLAKIRRLLKDDGILFIACPSLDSWSAKILKERWMEFKPEHIHYFSSKTLQSLLFHMGFGEMVELPGQKTLSLDYVSGHFKKYPIPGISQLMKLSSILLPRFLRSKPISVVASGVVIMSRKKEIPARRKLSVVIPAFNEKATVKKVIDGLLAKKFAGLDLEIVIVESGSTDGTREIVLNYKNHPQVKVILEEKPKGKGHAVRAGLEQTTGDFILIQDADLEYDLEDYDGLLEPLVSGREAFVLGSRHGGRRWKLRSFEGNPITSLLFNLGHYFFAWAINILFYVNIKDPFTMYKVFRRDCLYGMKLSCNRFDFDFEILINLVKKRYRPIEIPVNYRSRSFSEGKKVSFFRDPWTWLLILTRMKLTTLDVLENAYEAQKKKVKTTDSPKEAKSLEPQNLLQ